MITLIDWYFCRGLFYKNYLHSNRHQEEKRISEGRYKIIMSVASLILLIFVINQNVILSKYSLKHTE